MYNTIPYDVGAALQLSAALRNAAAALSGQAAECLTLRATLLSEWTGHYRDEYESILPSRHAQASDVASQLRQLAERVDALTTQARYAQAHGRGI